LLLTTTFATALALAMDAVAVAIASGLSVKTLRFRDALKMAFFFGAFQGVMPLLGYLLGLGVAQWLMAYNHWIAFVILLGLGLKMIHESRTAADERVHSPFRTRKLLVLAIATSLDAFAVGIGFSLLNTGLIATVAIIAIVTFALCLPAVWFGARLGKTMAKRAEVFGGVVLILIGAKILLEHLFAGA
jgi:manganese efflux pump family protein